MNERESHIFRDLIRSMRIDADLRQMDVAERMGLPQSFVSKCESGERRVDILELAAICRACGSDLREFVNTLLLRLEENSK